MNKSNPKSKKQQPKLHNKAQKKSKPLTKSKRPITTASHKTQLPTFTPQTLLPTFQPRTRNISTLISSQSHHQQHFSQSNNLSQSFVPQFNFAPKFTPQNIPFSLSKRNIILKPSKPLDPEVDLIFEFNILKEAQPITELKDAEYPEWLWSVADPQKTLYEIAKIPGEDLDVPTLRRKFKLERRQLIRDNNNSTRK